MESLTITMDVVNTTSFADAQMKTVQNSITLNLLNAQKLYNF